ncbi:hypothetical protein EJB05_22480, partial [Eragrostis curvula]
MCRVYSSGKEDSPLCDVPGCENCRMKLLRHVSFVDCPNKIDLIQKAAAMNLHEAIQKFMQNELQFAVPGGLIGVGTTMDPTLTRADRLFSQVNFFLLRRLLGVRTSGTERASRVSKLAKAEILMVNIGTMFTGSRVVAVKNDLAKLQLTSSGCSSKGKKLALSRRIEKHWHLIGWGMIQAGTTLDVPPCPL